jgi:hypothetical protein
MATSKLQDLRKFVLRIQLAQEFLWQQGLDSFGFPPRQYGRRDWREGLTL